MNTLLYKNIPLTLYSWKDWCFLCVRGELKMETDCYILTQSFSRDHSSTSSASWLGCSTWVVEGPSPLSGAGSHSAGILSPTAIGTELTQAVCGTWLYNCLTPTCFLWAYASAPNSTTSIGQVDIPISSIGCTCFAFLRLFTQVHLLIDSSVEGQYVTLDEESNHFTTFQTGFGWYQKLKLSFENYKKFQKCFHLILDSLNGVIYIVCDIVFLYVFYR